MAYRVLGIAPYEGLRDLMEHVAKQFPDMDLTAVVGESTKGLRFAQQAMTEQQYDVLLSRGETARLLRDSGLPVVDVEITAQDLISTLKHVNRLTDKIAIVALADIADTVHFLSSTLGYQVDFVPVGKAEHVAGILQTCLKVRYGAILGDTAVTSIAKRMGINCFLITSSAYSVEQAMRSALALCENMRNLRDKNMFYQHLLSCQQEKVIVLKKDGSLFYTNCSETPEDLLKYLRTELNHTLESDSRFIRHTIQKISYTILASPFMVGNEALAEFHLTKQATTTRAAIAGIRYLSLQEVKTSFTQNPFNSIELIEPLQNAAMHLIDAQFPVMITGEDGTGKPTLAAMLYSRSRKRSNAYVTINCAHLQKHSWAFLLENDSSPLLLENCSLYFSSLDTLSASDCERLLSAILEFDTHKRNAVFFSSIQREGEQLSPNGTLFRDALDCLTIHIPALRTQKDRIPSMIQLSINFFNTRASRPVSDVEAAAITYLQEFPWPYNLTQFNRILRDLVNNVEDATITGKQVYSVLQQERYPGSFFSLIDDQSPPINLKKPLNEINREIAALVVRELGGSHTDAAKSLGISRTTLWRLLKK